MIGLLKWWVCYSQVCFQGPWVPELVGGGLVAEVIPDPLGQHGPLPDAAEKEGQRFPAQEPAEAIRATGGDGGG
jgi:hypothetical protein